MNLISIDVYKRQILMDIMMQEMDGVTALQEFRDRALNPSSPEIRGT